MEPDFVTRQHLDSVKVSSDPSILELLNNYKHPPVEPKPQPQLSGFAGAPPAQPQQSNSDVLFSNMLGQIQGTLQQLGNLRNTEAQLPSRFDGLQLSVNADILRWVVLLVILVVLVWVVLTILKQRKKRRNPLNRRIRKLEKKIRRLKMSRNPKRTHELPAPVESEEDDEGFDFSDDDDDFDDELDDLVD